MADDEDCDDERAVELATIAAIFPELVIDSSNPFSASLEIPVFPAKVLAVLFPPLTSGAQSVGLITPPSSDGSNDVALAKDGAASKVIQITYLSHLPPIILRVTLPDGYPADAPPQIQLASDSSWLPQDKLRELQDAGPRMWEDLGHNQVVYDYVDYLQQAAEDGFGLVKQGGCAIEIPEALELVLLDYDMKAKRAKFEQETFECGVCIEPKKGVACHRLQLCGHVFCIACLQDFYNSCITEGDITNVKCLAPNCGKDQKAAQPDAGTRGGRRRRKGDLTLEPSELLQIPLEQATVQRYIKLRRKKMLESDRNTVYCPRQWCQGPARSKKYPKREDSNDTEAEAEEEEDAVPIQNQEVDAGEDILPPPSERLAVCEDCSFAFCSVCKCGWHGEFAKCFPRRQYELSAEEKASEDYVKKHSTPCPTCDARAQKTSGCNHMICFKCNTHFCYLCSAWLTEDNPYIHFNTAWMPCYQRLWELEDGDGIGVERNPVPPALPPVEVVFEEEEVNNEGEDDHGGDHGIPPAAPAPPPARAHVQAPAPRANGVRVNARAQQGLVRRAPLLNNVNPDQGLQRFLRLAANDEEDDWDSDDFDSEEDGRWDIPIR